MPDYSKKKALKEIQDLKFLCQVQRLENDKLKAENKVLKHQINELKVGE